MLALLLSVFAETGFSASEKPRLAIVHLEQIKPYQSLNNKLVRAIGNKLEIRTFEIGSNGESGDRLVNKLKDFNPAIVVCMGNRAYKLCEKLDKTPVVLAYDINLLIEQNPFCVLKYLRPKAKKIILLSEKDITEGQGDLLVDLASRYDLKLSIEQNGQLSWKDLVSGNDAVLLQNGVMLLSPQKPKAFSNNGDVVAVVDRSVESYKQLEWNCARGLPKIDKIIDLSKTLPGGDLERKLKSINPSVILCIGVNSYKYCKFMQGKTLVLVAFKTKAITNEIYRWGNLSGVSMFVEPKEQFEVLKLLVQKPLRLGIPYNPENSELVVLKALLAEWGDINLIPLPVSSPKVASKVLGKSLNSFDGLWIIPDLTVMSTPIQRYLLEESLLKKKLLISMMHPYTKAGATMAVSTVSKNDDKLCEKMIELIDERLKRSDCGGRIVFPTPSVSLNVRTIKKLNYTLSESLLGIAEFIFGEE